jgi:small GTP-binding protein
MSSTSMTYVQKKLTLNRQKISLNIWDTVGQEKFRSLSKLFFKDTKIVILVYSIVDKKSFDNLGYWLNSVKETIGSDFILGVVGNKCDLFLEQKVDEELGVEFAKQNGGIFEQISAKENKAGLDNYITKLVMEYLKLNPQEITNKNKNSIHLFKDGENTEELKAGCCTGGKNKKIIKKYSDIVKENNGVINVVFLGDISSGKTSIINRIKKKEFKNEEKHTEKIVKSYIPYNKGKMKLEVIINDVNIDNKKSFEFIDLIKKCSIYFLVYDIQENKSVENVYYWIEVIKKIKENTTNDSFYILANKNDLYTGNDKLIERGKFIAEENNAVFKIVSAKNNEGFEGIIEESVDNYLSLS